MNNQFVDWAAKSSICNFVELSHPEKGNSYKTIATLGRNLEAAEMEFQKTGKRTLIHVNGFDRLLNPKLTPPDNIATLKDIMSAASEDYRSTIIFSAKDPKQLDQIALQPHRVKIIQMDMNPSEMKKVESDLKELIKFSKLIETQKELKKAREELEKKLKSLPKTKIAVGTLIGLAAGTALAAYNYFANKDKNQRRS